MKYLSKTTSSGDTAFPWKLHMVLEESVWGGFDEIISWQCNNAFKVHDPIQFEQSIMQRFFNQTRYKSFQRQLNIYGFIRMKTAGKATGSYTHPLFIRGNPDACRFMTRTKIKKKGIRSNCHYIIKEGKPINKDDFIRSSSSGSRSDDEPLMNRFNNGIIEPRPIFSIEPKPIRIDSLGANMCNKIMMTMHAHTISPNIVPCDKRHNKINSEFPDANGQCSVQETTILSRIISTQSVYDNVDRADVPHSFHQSEQQHNYQYPRHTQYNNNVELDLDTIFDDDTSGCQINKGNYRSSNANIDSCFLSPLAVDNIFDRNFHMVQEEMMSVHV